MGTPYRVPFLYLRCFARWRTIYAIVGGLNVICKFATAKFANILVLHQSLNQLLCQLSKLFDGSAPTVEKPHLFVLLTVFASFV